MQARSRKNKPKPSELTDSKAQQTLEENWEDYRQYWVNAITEFREKGLITDEHLRRYPKLARALKSFLGKQRGPTK
jgi:hypothetical protein